MNPYQQTVPEKLLNSQYGNTLINANQNALLRGTGGFNPPPKFEQTTNRGNAYDDAYQVFAGQAGIIEPDAKRPNPVDSSFEVALNSAGVQHQLFSGHSNKKDPVSGIAAQSTFQLPALQKNSKGVSKVGLVPMAAMDPYNKDGYSVGNSGFHPQAPGSWNRPTFEAAQDQYITWAVNALQIAPNSLLVYFFSKQNVDYIQDKIVENVKKIRDVKINHQSTDELLIIMRNHYIYAQSGWLPHAGDPNKPYPRGEQYGQMELPSGNRISLACSLEEQLERLNKSVLEESVKQVLSGIDMYRQYYKDASSLPMPLSRPVYASDKGSRVLSENVGFSNGHEATRAAQSYNQRYNIL